MTNPNLTAALAWLDGPWQAADNKRDAANVAASIRQLRGNLSLAEEGLANYALEVQGLQQFKEWAEPQCQDYAANRNEIERLQAKLHSVRARCLNLAQWIDKGCDPKHGATEASFIALFAKDPSDEPLPVASRDADHCDYPDCEQHWTNVVAQARALLEPLAEHDPAIRQWLRTPDLPKLRALKSGDSQS